LRETSCDRPVATVVPWWSRPASIQCLVEDVTADDPGDVENIALIRGHLADERKRFQRGDFGDPAEIHGDEMPGLTELEAGAAEIEITYEDLDDGARLTFTAGDPTLVEALHRLGGSPGHRPRRCTPTV
jgi:hypothetical protein